MCLVAFLPQVYGILRVLLRTYRTPMIMIHEWGGTPPLGPAIWSWYAPFEDVFELHDALFVRRRGGDGKVNIDMRLCVPSCETRGQLGNG